MSDEALPDYLPAKQHIDVGKRTFLLDTEAKIVRLTASSGPYARRAIAEFDIAAGLALYTKMRSEELARLAALEAEASAAEEDDSEDLDDDLTDTGNQAADPVDPASLIPVFTEEALKKSLVIAKSQETERRSRFEAVLKSAAQNRGYRARPVTNIKTLVAAITTLREDFPNFVHALDALEAALALSVGDPDYCIPPVLLHGEPGIGKTTFAMSIADRLGVSFDMVSAGSLQGGFDLAGTSSHWSNASAGRVVRLLADSDSASPVLLIDEVDKVGGDERYSPVNTLLDLLEQRTACRFRDEALQLQFDASRMIVIMTANDLRSMPAPLLSRAQVIAIEPMSAGQRFAIVRKLVDKHAGELAIDDETIERFGTTGDLRKLQLVIKKAAGLAKARGDSALFFSILANESPHDTHDTDRRIGF